MIYMDYNATTPLASEVAQAMTPWHQPQASNPSSVHRWGQRARAAVEESRRSVAMFCGNHRHQVIFTSGGTEADNLALYGACWPPDGHLLVSGVEHPAVLEAAEVMSTLGLAVERLAVDGAGIVDPDAVRRALRPNTRLVSVMAANNETGCLQPIEEIAAVTREAGVLLHCDAVQAASWLDLAPLGADCDLLSLSAHKLGGPLGIGALVCRSGLDLRPQILGGGQQGGRRAGTEPTPLIVGFAAACERVQKLRPEANRVRCLRDDLEITLLESIPESRRNGPKHTRLPNTLHLSFQHCRGDLLVARLDLDGLAASAGSACASGVAHPSHVLAAMGVVTTYSQGSLRLSLGYETGRSEVETALELVPIAVAAARAAAIPSRACSRSR